MVQRYTNPFGSQGSYADELRKKRERDQRELIKRLTAQQNYRQSLQRVQDIETIAENQNKNIEQLTNVPTVESYSPTRKVEIKTDTPPSFRSYIDVPEPIAKPVDERERGTNAGIKLLNKAAEVVSFVEGTAYRFIPGNQEFDKKLQEVMREREAAGKPAGPRQFIATSAEAARRSEQSRRIGIPFVSGVFNSVGNILNTAGFRGGVEYFTGLNFRQLDENYIRFFKEETGVDPYSAKAADNVIFSGASFRAWQKAWDATDQPKYVKGFLEFALDPINLVGGVGFYKSVASGLQTATKLSWAGTKAIPASIQKTPQVAQGIKNIATGETTVTQLAANKFKAVKDKLKPKDKKKFEEETQPVLEDRVVTYVPGISGDYTMQLQSFTQYFRNKFKVLDSSYFKRSNLEKQETFTKNTDRAVTHTLSKYQQNKFQDAIRKLHSAFDRRGLTPFYKTFAYTAGMITPRTFLKLKTKTQDLQTWKVKSAIVNDHMIQNAELTVRNILAKTKTFKENFSTEIQGVESIQDSLISFSDKKLAKLINTKIREAYLKSQDAADIKKVRLKDLSFDKGAGGSFTRNRTYHESDVMTGIIKYKYEEIDGVINYTVDLADEFKKFDNIFWKNGDLTEQGHYFVQRSKAYTEGAKLLDELGIPVKNLQGKELSGVELLEHLQQGHAYSARYATRKSLQDQRIDKYINTSEYVNPNTKLSKSYNNVRKILDPEELLAQVDAGNLAYSTPEDALKLYFQGVYKQASQVYADQSMVNLLRNNKSLQKRYGVVFVTGSKEPDDSLYYLTRSGKTGRAKIKQLKEDKSKSFTQPATFEDEITALTDKDKIFERLAFYDTDAAKTFATQADIFLEVGDYTPKVGNFQTWSTAVQRYARDVALGENVPVIGKYSTVVQGSLAALSAAGRLGGTGLDLGGALLYGGIMFGKAQDLLIRQGILKGDTKKIQEGLGILDGLGKSLAYSFESIARPNTVTNRIYSQYDKKILDMAAASGLNLSKNTVEVFESLNRGGPVTKFLNKLPTITTRIPLIKDPVTLSAPGAFRRAESAWSNAIDQIKLSSFKSMTSHLDATKDADEIRMIADFINKGTGTMNTATAGIGRFQRQIETDFLFFSSRMTRGTTGLIVDALTRGGTSGQLAREGIMGSLISKLGYTWLVGEMLGQEVNLDPSKPRFGQLRIGDSYVGFAGQDLSNLKVYSNLLLGDNDEQYLYNQTGIDGKPTPNRLVKLIKSRINAPAGGAVIEAITRENYFGEPYDGAISFASAQSKRLLPFWVDGLRGSDTADPSAITSGTEIFGLRSSNVSIYERKKEIKNDITRELFPDFDNFTELDSVAQKLIYNELEKDSSDSIPEDLHDEYKRYDTLTKQVRLANNQDNQVDVWRDSLDTITENKRNDIESAIRDYETTNQTTIDLRIKLQQINEQYRPAYNTLYDEQGEFADVHNYFKIMDNSKNTENQIDTWIDAYKNTVAFNPEHQVVSENGIEYYDYNARERAKDEFIRNYGVKAYETVRQYFELGNNNVTDIERELYNAQEKFNYYWRASEEKAIEFVSKQYNTEPELIKSLLDQYDQLAEVEKRRLYENYPILKDVQSLRAQIRRELRVNNQALDGFLYRWGYTSTLINPKNTGINQTLAENFWLQKEAIDVNDPNDYYLLYDNN